MQKLTQYSVAIAISAFAWVSIPFRADAATVNLNQQGNITSISCIADFMYENDCA